MNVLFRLITLLLVYIVVEGKGVKFNGFEPRRPIKYFFHLLELKSDFNPLFYPTVSSRKVCSSKVGPFCDLTGHAPLKTHSLREVPAQVKGMEAQLMNNVKYAYQTYQNVEKNQNQMFLIRNSFTNTYDTYLRKQMGDLNNEDMLAQSKFINTLLRD